jgi:hypothetical protein
VAVPGIAISVSGTSGSGSPLSGDAGDRRLQERVLLVAAGRGRVLAAAAAGARATRVVPAVLVLTRCDARSVGGCPGSRGSEDSCCRSSTRAVTPSAVVGVAASIERKGTPSAPRTASHTAAPTAASTIRSRARGRQAGRAEQLLLGWCRRPVDLSGVRDGVRAFHGAPRSEALGECLVKCRY